MTFDGTRPTFATLRTDSILPVGGLPGGASGGGIVQVVSTQKTNIFTTTSVSYVDKFLLRFI
jgi:formyltetrahydrofolate synthetase